MVGLIIILLLTVLSSVHANLFAASIDSSKQCSQCLGSEGGRVCKYGSSSYCCDLEKTKMESLLLEPVEALADMCSPHNLCSDQVSDKLFSCP